MRCQAAARSSPVSWDGVTLTFRPRTWISTWSGCAAMLWYQAGFFALPPNAAQISQALSPSGNEASKVSRRWPDLAPVVVSTSVSMPMNRPFDLPRATRTIRLLTHLETGLLTPGMLLPRVPAGVFSNAIVVLQYEQWVQWEEAAYVLDDKRRARTVSARRR